jgi:hypothetical protein
LLGNSYRIGDRNRLGDIHRNRYRFRHRNSLGHGNGHWLDHLVNIGANAVANAVASAVASANPVGIAETTDAVSDTTDAVRDTTHAVRDTTPVRDTIGGVCIGKGAEANCRTKRIASNTTQGQSVTGKSPCAHAHCASHATDGTGISTAVAICRAL